jgi:hypothetical protein
MELFLLYVWLKIDTLIFLSWAFLIISCIILAAVNLSCWIDSGEIPNLIKNNSKKIVSALLICLSLGVFLPTKTDLAILVGGYYALETVKSPEGQKIVSLLRKKANEILDKELNNEVNEKAVPK